MSKIRVFVTLIVTLSPLALSACLENTGIQAKPGYSLTSLQSNCLLPDAAVVKTTAQRLAASSIQVGADFCSNPSGYDCISHRFGPSLVNGETISGESANVAELGGDVSISVSSKSFNTLGAARAPGVSASASQPGGELNHVEYVCYQHDLRDGETSLALGEGDTLKDALGAAYARCAAVAPRVAGK